MVARTTRLKQLINSPALTLILEAHNGLSARIAEEAGFGAIWASGLAIAASLGVRDSNEASWTQCLECVEFMADAASVPILMDGDTGYGNFNNVRRLVAKLEQRGVAGVCLEDKRFPKTNSYLAGSTQPLAAIDEFAGKIRAARDAQRDSDFVVIARTEALITGHGLGEALERAYAYRRAGADAILVHSARPDAQEVFAFKREWGDALPVIAVPTTYHATPTQLFRAYGFSALIWANHLLRSSIAAMQRTAADLFATQSPALIEPTIVPMQEVFRLQRVSELEAAERRYLPAAGSPTDATRLRRTRKQIA